MSNNKIIFLHIPKAGGSTFRRILQEHYSPDRIYEISRVSMQKSIDEFINLNPARRKEIFVLMGHMDFGLHKYLEGPAKYITMVRKPSSRVVSNYHFIKRSPYHPYYDQIVNNNLTLKDYVESGMNANINNGMVKNIAGVKTIKPGEEDKVLALAKENIQKYFNFVGLMEKFDESLLLLKLELEWKGQPNYFKRKVSNKKIELTKEERQAIIEKNALDQDFYDWAEQRFEALCQKNQTYLTNELPGFLEENKKQKADTSFDTIYQKYKFPIQLIAKKIIPIKLIKKIWPV